MNQRMVVINLEQGEVGVTLGDAYRYFTTPPVSLTIVYVCVSSSVDDTGLTIDINGGGSALVAAVSAADKDVPGTWISKHFGGSEDPVVVPGSTVISLDANAAAANSVAHVQIWALIDEA